MGVKAMKKHLIFCVGLIMILLLLLCQAVAAQADTPQPSKSADEWASEGYTVIYLEDASGPDETDGQLIGGFFVLRKDINYLTKKPGSENAVNGNSFTRSAFQTVQTGNGNNANMYCLQSGDRYYFGHVDTEANGDTIVLKDMVSINNCQYSPNVTPYTVGAWIDWRAKFKADIPGVPFFGEGYLQIFLDHYSHDPGTLSPTEHTIEYYNSLHFDEIGVKSEDVITEQYDVGIYSIEKFVSALRLRLTLQHYWGELAFDADALMGVEVLFKSYGPVFWGWSAIPHPKNGFTINKVSKANSYGDITLALNLGPKISAEWILIQDLELDVDVFGVLLIGEYSGHDLEPPVEKTTYHLCTNCADESLQGIMGPLKLIIDLVGSDPQTLIDTGPVYLGEYYHFYYSEEYDESGEGTCPHRAYHTRVNVTDSTNSSPLSNVNVSFHPDSFDCSPYNKGTTGLDGIVDLYMKPGEDYYVIAELESPLDPEQVIRKERMMHKGETADTVDIALDIPVKTVYFKNSQTGEATDWPDDISFSPFLSKGVNLPQKIPMLSGRQFTGWNTKEDGSGTTYAPGTTLTLEDDLTLWAQWVTAGDDWYVIYNANGGTKAPKPEIVRCGQDAALTRELPEAGKMIFKGWTPDLHTMDPLYQPGDTLPYDSSKNVVVLYAVWDLSPVPQPIHISFEANGAEGAELPPDVWMEQNSWYQMPYAVAPVGKAYAFKGWSEDPGNADPEFKAGKSYYFYKDTTLYAIWDDKDVMTLSLLDSLPGSASNMPKQIVIMPSMSRYVKIPGQIPEKSGRVFTGWNTERHGHGTKYAPGSVITLWKDTALWAQWEEAGDSWYVIYDANGGTKAPGAQIIPRGKDAVLTSVAAESPSMTFKGWATDPYAVTAEYQPGDTLKYDSGKNYVVLYALWELDPAQRPVVISFDANGGLPDTVPKTISAPQKTWVQLPGKEPSWDAQHDFLGWAADPKASEPQWKAGDTVLFDQDTKLYAIWHAHYKVIEGAGSVWTKGSGKTQRFVADGNVKYFEELRVDGRPFNEGVHISSGSTIADINASAMEKLSVGSHTVTFIYKDGMAGASFTVQKKVPQTGDAGNPALWLGLIMLGITGIVLRGRKRKIKGED